MPSDLKLQEWISRISDDDRKRVAHTFRFDAHPSEFSELFNELRQRYDFIPQPIPNERTDAVESVLKQLSELVATLSLDEMMFLERNSVTYSRLSSTLRAGMQVDITELEADLRTASDQCEALSKDNTKLRELAREWQIAFETSNVRAIPELKRRTEEQTYHAE